jgi:hypothetical protein
VTDLLLLLALFLAGPLLGLGAAWADGNPTSRRVLLSTLVGAVIVWELGALIILPGTEHGGLGVGRSFATAGVYGALDGLGVGLLFLAGRALFKRRSGHRTA